MLQGVEKTLQVKMSFIAHDDPRDLTWRELKLQ